jgi:hypothetical protein
MKLNAVAVRPFDCERCRARVVRGERMAVHQGRRLCAACAGPGAGELDDRCQHVGGCDRRAAMVLESANGKVSGRRCLEHVQRALDDGFAPR